MNNPNPPRCECKRTELRRRKTSAGSIYASYQCLDCGRNAQTVRKGNIDVSTLPWWNDDLETAWQERRKKYWDEWQRQVDRQRQEENEDFWRRYNLHLASEKWRELRRHVIKRCQNICEGCGLRPVAQVHHLTYERMGDEMLFDLVGVCLMCHTKIHERGIDS